VKDKLFNRLLAISFLIVLLAFTMAVVGCGGSNGNGGGGNGDPRPSSPQPMTTKTAMQYFTDEGITIGINMGNTLDAVQFWNDQYYTASPSNPIAVETAWGNPKANQAYFNGLKNLGFKIVRIPVTWLGHVGSAPNYVIEEAYLKRVAEVVNMAHNAGLKCFINIHHDGNHSQGYTGWLNINNAATDSSITTKFEKMWIQIADYFKNYGDYLMFQGFNEIHSGDWGHAGTQAQYNIINDWNQKFTNAVRGTGGNNTNRYLLYYGYMVSTEIATSSYFSLPTDTASGKQIVGFHYYEPGNFSLLTTSHTWAEFENGNIAKYFAQFKTKFIDNGIPVIIGENGPARYVDYPGNTGFNSSNVATAKANRLTFIDLLYGTARANGLVPFYWENGSWTYENAAEGDFSLINRNNGQANSTESAEVITRMMTAINNATPPSSPTPPTNITGNLGNYRFGTDDGVNFTNYNQAVWELSSSNVTLAKTTGTKLVLQLTGIPNKSIILSWQNPSTSSWWNEKNILGDTGNILNAGSVTWGSNTLTITLNADTVDDYANTFPSAASLNIILQYGGSNVNDLGIISANLQ
jgi:endoglucanase